MNAICEPVDQACWHCGQAAPPDTPWQAEIHGERRPMCCPGCAAAAQAIAEAGLAGYYDTRAAFAARPDEADGQAWSLYDELMEDGDAVFSVDGIRCAACVWLIERRIAALPGVDEVMLNVATERLHVRWRPDACRAGTILRALHAIGYAASPYDASRHVARLERARKTLFRRLFVAGLAMMQVMMYAVPVYMAGEAHDPDIMDADMRALMGWASLLLTLPAVTYSAWPFFRGACADLRRGLPGMDVPVALGIAAAFGASMVALVRGSGAVYFDSITMFVFLLLGSRYLELNARRKAAGALERLQHAAPAGALRLVGWPATHETETVAAGVLQTGDMVLVPPGQAVPADGVVVEGDTEADLALLTGESRTRRIGPGDTLPGGAVNVAAGVVLRVTSSARDSTLALLVRMVERAGQDKPAIAQQADRVGAWFVVALLGLTLGVFGTWQLIDPARAWQAAIAVLVVSCPCALSLATPTALAAATDRLLRHGVLAVKPHVLETLQLTSHIVFDKTGTLTRGRPALRRTACFGAMDAAGCLQLAAALEAGSVHPLAQALRDAAGRPSLKAAQARYRVGEGVEGEVDGRHYRLGSAAFVGALAGTPPPCAATDGVSAVWLGAADGWLARFDLADDIRPEAQAVVQACRRRGKTVMLLSGDEDAAAQAVAARLGIAHARGGQLPEDKLAAVRALQREGAVVAMVGDGINDAAVLNGADVSFAMGQGTQLAQLHADCVLLDGEDRGLRPLADALDTADATLRVIRQNLGWAMAYNLAAIPLAACGLLGPWLSGLGMAASSALVVLNASRLRRG